MHESAVHHTESGSADPMGGRFSTIEEQPYSNGSRHLYGINAETGKKEHISWEQVAQAHGYELGGDDRPQGVDPSEIAGSEGINLVEETQSDEDRLKEHARWQMNVDTASIKPSERGLTVDDMAYNSWFKDKAPNEGNSRSLREKMAEDKTQSERKAHLDSLRDFARLEMRVKTGAASGEEAAYYYDVQEKNEQPADSKQPNAPEAKGIIDEALQAAEAEVRTSWGKLEEASIKELNQFGEAATDAYENYLLRSSFSEEDREKAREDFQRQILALKNKRYKAEEDKYPSAPEAGTEPEVSAEVAALMERGTQALNAELKGLADKIRAAREAGQTTDMQLAQAQLDRHFKAYALTVELNGDDKQDRYNQIMEYIRTGKKPAQANVAPDKQPSKPDKQPAQPDKSKVESKRLKRFMTKVGSLALTPVVAAVYLPTTIKQINSWADSKMPEQWSPRKKGVVRAVGAVATVALGVGVVWGARKINNEVFNSGTGQSLGNNPGEIPPSGGSGGGGGDAGEVAHEFTVEPGDGISHEVADFAKSLDKPISQDKLAEITNGLQEKFGTNIIDGIDQYKTASGEIRLGQPGTGMWTPEAEAYIRQMLGLG